MFVGLISLYDAHIYEHTLQTTCMFTVQHLSELWMHTSCCYRAMEQIKRCDLHPEGWFSSAGGPDSTSPATWECTNMTISRIGEMPQNCQYSTFWGFPDDMVYKGATVLNGIACDQWVYFSQADQYTLYARMLHEETGESVPVVSQVKWSVILQSTGRTSLHNTSRSGCDI